MIRRMMMLMTLIVATAGVAPVFAHEEFRVIGTVTKVQSSKLGVKTKEGKEISIAIDKQTSFTRDQKKTDVSQVKTGQSVVVDAYGDSYDDLLALEVRIVPAIAPSSAK
jgi:hypothetical protein